MTVGPLAGYDTDVIWRLLYGSGLQVDEPPGGGTIRGTPPRPTELRVVSPATGVPVFAIDVQGCRPVFYRERSMVLGQPASVDRTVFGYLWDDDTEVHSSLWSLVPGGMVGPCPEDIIVPSVLELFLTAP